MDRRGRYFSGHARWICALAVGVFTVAASTVEAQAQPSPQYPKRGWGGTINSAYNSNRINANWYYTWGRVPHTGSYAEFIPMAWNGNAVTNPTSYAQLTSQSSEWILGFNEPERAEQSNMTPDQALALWPQLMASGKKLVSPAVGSDTLGRAWISEFMTKATALNTANPGTIRIDAIAMHWYGDVRVTNAYSGLSSTIDNFYNTYTLNGTKLPIWLTEFAGLDFTSGANPVTEEDNRRFLAGALPLLDGKAHLHRYAWFNWRPEASAGSLPSGATDVPGSPYTPTTLGDLYNGRTYATNQSVALAGTEGTDTFYMRGGTVQNTGSVKAIRAIDFIEGSSRVQGDGNIDVRNGWVRVRSGATLGKWQANSLNLAGVTVYNDGAIAGKQGFVILSDGTIVQGTGYIRTEWNADTTPEGITLTESAPGLGGVTVNNRIWLNGGQYNILAGSHVHNGELTLSSNSFANVTGNLTMTGQMTGAGTLGKSGTGTLRLDAGSVNTGAFSVTAGTLVVANETGSAHGTGSLTIGVNGTLSGDGSVGGTGVTINGRLSPTAVASRPRSLRFNSPLTLSSTARVVMDVGLLQPDRVDSTSTVSLDGTLELRSTILPADMIPMTILTASAVNGIFDRVEGIEVLTETNRALAVTYSANSIIVTKTLPGDANLDGAVEFEDLLRIAANYGGTGRSWTTADFNGDGLTDFDDLLPIARNYGTSFLGQMGAGPVPSGMLDGSFAADWALAQSMVPEPASLVLVPCVAMLLQRRR